MYQIEVKRHLVERRFDPEAGWKVTVHVDGMEMGRGAQNPPEKTEIATKARTWMEDRGVTIGAHAAFGATDIVAEHPTDDQVFLVEVEGFSSRQREQQTYSALGQIILCMNSDSRNVTYGIAVPDDEDWKKQIEKIPHRVCRLLNLELMLVSSGGVRYIYSDD